MSGVCVVLCPSARSEFAGVIKERDLAERKKMARYVTGQACPGAKGEASAILIEIPSAPRAELIDA